MYVEKQLKDLKQKIDNINHCKRGVAEYLSKPDRPISQVNIFTDQYSALCKNQGLLRQEYNALKLQKESSNA